MGGMLMLGKKAEEISQLSNEFYIDVSGLALMNETKQKFKFEINDGDELSLKIKKNLNNLFLLQNGNMI